MHDMPSQSLLISSDHYNHGRIQLGGGQNPFLAHYVGFLTLGPKLDPLLEPPPFLLVHLRWTPFSKILDPPLITIIIVIIISTVIRIVVTITQWTRMFRVYCACRCLILENDGTPGKRVSKHHEADGERHMLTQTFLRATNTFRLEMSSPREATAFTSCK